MALRVSIVDSARGSTEEFPGAPPRPMLPGPSARVAPTPAPAANTFRGWRSYRPRSAAGQRHGAAHSYRIKTPRRWGLRHSSAHLLAAAVLEFFPETKLGHGPATENGFFYDFYRPTPFTPEDLEKIEKKMQELVQQNLPYARNFWIRQPGLDRFKVKAIL